ncbi:MAG: ABC transporter permease subunit [Gammaproteobacteria bacterium]|nr:ABC transporter permease subunit [Gammaproteobacteria bacterium]MCW8958080.1 ABC transporter permease subunit [Gammaproteobacteria bacterium]MCW8971688.1 ABC transporter permease subunit [Gammaproteobacteria bacterium]MCW8993407.1 ABC transporter permease subunit [Gammaproteobacteria bacterium]
MTTVSSPSSHNSLTGSAATPRNRWRMLKDRLARRGVAVGGIGVIIAIVLIFFYLLYVVFPLFVPASSEKIASYPLPGTGETMVLDIEEQSGMAVRYTSEGQAIFFATRDGGIKETLSLVPEGRRITSQARAIAGSPLLGLGLDDGRVVIARHGFKVGYAEDTEVLTRTLTPTIDYPYGKEPLELLPQGAPVAHLSMRDSEDQLLLAAVTGNGQVVLGRFTKQTSFLSEEITLERDLVVIDGLDISPDYLLLGTDLRRLYVASRDGTLLHYDINGTPRQLERLQLLGRGEQLSSLRMLVGGISLLAGSTTGKVVQWFPVRDEHNNHHLTRVREFALAGQPITAIASEERRKGFLVGDEQGRVGLYHSTAERKLLVEQVADTPIVQITNAPRSDTFMVEDSAGRLHFWRVHNEHPEISWSALWGKVHYEGYSEPAHIWQSSSASNDFEPKFSLTPLAFGTLKAAFYAMLIAVPLAILGAIFTAYFMAPRMRKAVKPTIEIMEALPTVILGFLAGLWLAPVLETHMPGVFAMLLVLPLGILAFAYAWHRLPRGLRNRVPDGWEAALLIPVVIALVWLSFEVSLPLERALFDGDMRAWLHNELGISYDQRNSMVVGLAMGFAVIPTIFSIAEDAIFSVPRHLTFGSLALGATPWQTMMRVVILTASPGIFSAIMIGVGRAVGETMIVLMATGNTPVMDFSIFQGMRTLSANIAVEMPESEVASTHYRVLFLAALVLFIFTFFFNTLAELVRQRLRRKYSSL